MNYIYARLPGITDVHTSIIKQFLQKDASLKLAEAGTVLNTSIQEVKIITNGAVSLHSKAKAHDPKSKHGFQKQALGKKLCEVECSPDKPLQMGEEPYLLGVMSPFDYVTTKPCLMIVFHAVHLFKIVG